MFRLALTIQRHSTVIPSSVVEEHPYPHPHPHPHTPTHSYIWTVFSQTNHQPEHLTGTTTPYPTLVSPYPDPTGVTHLSAYLGAPVIEPPIPSPSPPEIYRKWSYSTAVHRPHGRGSSIYQSTGLLGPGFLAIDGHGVLG